MIAAFTDALRDRYQIIGELGRGGMATVYRARDLRHDRFVALKVLHAELAATLGLERFQREIRLAAKLQHPHILTVHDSGEAAGLLWFTMPLIEGETLRQRLNRETQLPVEEALRLTREVADALDSAHRHGVIHRDIKPENILLSEGHALVADFGIARALDVGASTITEPGMVIGTPAYMSPEQASGESVTDARTDVYSLGIVLYEMLAGEVPFSGPTAAAVMARALTETPRPLQSVRSLVPGAVQTLVSKAMARTPADRFRSAAEFGKALDRALVAGHTPEPGVAARPARRSRLALVGLGIVALGVVVFAWRQPRGGAGQDEGAPTARRLAVLPFDNMGDTDDGYFVDGVADEVRGKLASLPGLLVIARTTSIQYKQSAKTPTEVGRELGVDYVLTGTVRWDKSTGSRVRVSPELIDVKSGATRWQQPFDASLTDVFQVQGDIASRVATALDVQLAEPSKQQLEHRPTAVLAAYDAYLKGNEQFDRGITVTAALRQAISHYEQAVALDSTFLEGWSRLGESRAWLYVNALPTPELAADARIAAARALALGPNTASALETATYVSMHVLRQSDSALMYAERAARVAPTNAEVLSALGLAQTGVGRWQDAVSTLQRATDLDPKSLRTLRRYSWALLNTRDLALARQVADRTLLLAPASLDVVQARVMVNLAEGDLAGARRILRDVPREVEPSELAAYMAAYWDLFWVLDDAQQKLVLRLRPTLFDDDRGTWGLALASTWLLQGNRERARAYGDSAAASLARTLEANPTEVQTRVLLGLALAFKGRNEEAIREGERAVAEGGLGRSNYGPYINHQLARIYVLTGERDKAVAALEPLLREPYLLTPAWLRIDPTFDSLHGHARFEALVRGQTVQPLSLKRVSTSLPLVPLSAGG